MKRVLIVVIAFFYTGLSGQSYQQQQIDSIREVVSQFEGEEKLMEYKKLIRKYFNTNMDTVLFQLFDDEESEAKKSGDFEQQRFHKFIRLKALNNRFMYEEIIKIAPKYLEFFRDEGKEKHIDYFNIYYILAKSFIMKEDIETAIIQTQQMYEQAKMLNSNAGMAIALYTMSDIYDKQLRYEEQEKALRESIYLFENVDEIDLFTLQENAYMSLSEILIRTNRLNEVEEMIHKYEKFIRHIETKIPNIPRYNFFELNIMYHIQTGEYDKAELYCDTLINVIPQAVWTFHVMIYRFKIFAGRGQYDKALEVVDKVIELTTSVERQRASEVRRMKMEILAKTRQTDELLKLALYTIDINDSLYHSDLAYRIDELRTQYEVDKHVREKKYMRNFTYISILASILITVILLTWVRYSHIINIKNQGLMRKLREQDAMYAELEHRANFNEGITSELNISKYTDNNTLFARLNKMVKEQRLFADQNISRLSIAKYLGVSERMLYDCIKSNTGLNFTNYITHLRLVYARQLITNTENLFTMECIAIEAGFGSRSTFYRLFKENYGLSPDEYRKWIHKTSKIDVNIDNE
jgi:AraC-like DNA-binding protein/tetratricopeptide (TPR) repeat protein